VDSKWIRASTFSYNRNAIELAVAYASAIHTHLSVHGTAHPMSAAPRLFALDQQLIVSSAALFTSLILVSRETLLQACLLPVVLSAATLSMALMQVQSGRVCNPSLFPSMTTGVVPGSVDSASDPLLSGRGNYLPRQSQASYRSAFSSPSACRPSSGFDVDNEEADVRAMSPLQTGMLISVRALSAVMTEDEIDDDADEDDFDDNHGETLGASFRATLSLDLDLLVGAVDSNSIPLLSPLSPLPPPLSSPPPSAAAEEPI